MCTGCTDAAYREFREALEQGPDLLPSAALLPEPHKTGSDVAKESGFSKNTGGLAAGNAIIALQAETSVTSHRLVLLPSYFSINICSRTCLHPWLVFEAVT